MEIILLVVYGICSQYLNTCYALINSKSSIQKLNNNCLSKFRIYDTNLLNNFLAEFRICDSLSTQFPD